MNKRQIIILTIVGLIIFGATFAGVYLMKKSDDNKPKEQEKKALKLRDYSLEYGTYVGEEKEYDPDKDVIISNKVKIVLTKDTLGDQNYTVLDNSLYIKASNGNDIEMYEATKDNEFNLLAGNGIKYTLKK